MEDRTVIEPQAPGFPAGLAGGYEATQQAVTATCPVCRTPNPPAERYCQDCGFLLASAPAEIEPLPDVSQLPRLTGGDGREIVLNPGPNSVGRDSADILLPDPTVSRRHAQVHLDGNQVFVEDLGSTNGTAVAGRRLQPGERAAAVTGDTVKFGSVVLTLTVPGGDARSPVEAAPAAAPGPAETVDRGPAVGALELADGTRLPLYEGINPVGRRSGNQIVIHDAFMSGKHAEIHCSPGEAPRLIDVGSTNGTFVDGQRLAAHAPVDLADGSQFTMGKTPVTLRMETGAPTGDAAGDQAETESPSPEDLAAR